MLRINDVTQIWLGIQGENQARTIEIDVSDWVEDFPDAGFSVWMIAPGGTVPQATGASYVTADQKIVWSPSSTDTYVAGEGEAEIRLSEGTVVKKTKKIRVGISGSVTGGGSTLGADWQEYIDEADRIRALAVAAQLAAEQAQSMAETAAEETEGAAEMASQSATAAAGSASAAAASASAATTKANEASQSATTAAGSASAAAASANDASGAKDTAVAAKTSAETAASNATGAAIAAETAKGEAEDAQAAAEQAQAAAEQAAQDAQETVQDVVDDITDLNSALDYVGGLEKQTLSLAQENYKFTSSGTIVSQNGMNIYRLAVTAGKKYLVDVLQSSEAWIYYSVQNTSGLSASDTTRVLETGSNPGSQVVTIPEGGKYLFINCASDDTVSGVYVSDTVEDVADNAAAIAAETTARENAVSGLKTYTDGQLDVVDDAIFAEISVPSTQTASGWRLNESNGLCSSNADYSLVKYLVKAGLPYHIVCDDRWQFQNSASVPSSGISNRVGETYGAGAYTVIAPPGATYLIISTPTATSAISVKYLDSNTDEAVQKVNYVGGFQRESGTLAKAGYKFNANGTITTDSHFNIYRHSVKAGSKVLVYNKQNSGANCYATIQNNSGLSASDTSRVLLTVTKPGYNIVTVPVGGIHLFYNCDTSDNVSGLYKSNIVDTVDALATRLIVPDIIANNEDVLPAVNAASYYGVNKNGTPNYTKKYALLVTTDIHGFTDRMIAAVTYLNSIPSIDAGICLGDMAGSDFNSPYEWYINAVNSSAKNWYTVIGNHDGGNSASASVAATKAQVFSRWIESTRDKMGMASLDKTYYTWNTDTGITFIVLDCYDVPDTVDAGTGDYVVSRGTIAYSQAQITWLISTLGSVPSGNTVVLISHYLADPMTVDSGVWSQPNGIFDDESSDYENMIPDIINAWINGGTLSENYTATTTGLSSITVSADFSSRGAGKFACYLIGHTHKDLIGHITKYSGQKIACMAATAAGNYQNGNSDLPRAENTKDIDCITVFVVDPSTQTVRLVRIGSNVTIRLTDRTKFALEY